MKNRDLIQLLSKLDGETEVMILDGFNGGGFPREINYNRTATITDDDAENCADCEDIVGKKVFVLGYGAY